GRFLLTYPRAPRLCLHRRQCSSIPGIASNFDCRLRTGRRRPYATRVVSARAPGNRTAAYPAGAGRTCQFGIRSIVNRAARWRADLALTFIAVVWGATFVLVKQALLDVSTMYFLALRFGLASMSMLALFLPSFRRMPAPAFWRGLRGGAVAGGFLALGYVLQTFGLK